MGLRTGSVVGTLGERMTSRSISRNMTTTTTTASTINGILIQCNREKLPTEGFRLFCDGDKPKWGYMCGTHNIRNLWVRTSPHVGFWLSIGHHVKPSVSQWPRQDSLELMCVYVIAIVVLATGVLYPVS